MTLKHLLCPVVLGFVVAGCAGGEEPEPTPAITPPRPASPELVSAVQSASGGVVQAQTFFGRVVIGQPPAARSAALQTTGGR